MDYSSPSSDDDSILGFNPFSQSSQETPLPATLGKGKKKAAPKQKAKLPSSAKAKASTDTPPQCKGSTKTTSKSTPQSSMSDQEMLTKAGSVVKITSIPLYTTEIQQINWFRYGKVLLPVRTCEKEEGEGLHFSQEGSEFDETKKTLVQYLEVPMKEYTLADKRSLKPYDANTAKNWEEFLKEMKKKGKALDAHKTKLFVEKIVREIENKEPVESTRLDDILEEEDLVVDKPLEQAERQEVVNSSEDEEPYTQDGPNFTPQSHKSSGRKTEPIRPGDTILYYNPIYPAGDKRGRTITVVLSVDPRNKKRTLELANSACLDRETQVCRIKTWSRCKSVEHPGVFRRIDEFKLSKKEMDGKQREATRGEGEGERARKILKKNIEGFEGKVGKGSGMLNSFDLKGKNGGGGGDSGKKKMKISPAVSKSEPSSESESDDDFEEKTLSAKKKANVRKNKSKKGVGGGRGEEEKEEKEEKKVKKKKQSKTQKKKIGPLVFSKEH